MSGLEKFQASEAWRTNFKKFLFMERKPDLQNTKITESHRYSLDIEEDLKNIIEQKKKQKTVQFHSKEEIVTITSNTAEMEEQAGANILKKDKIEKDSMNRYDESAYGEVPMWQKTTDESFEMLEKMCEKTVSDPNSTLFKYLNCEAEQKTNNVLVWQKTSDESFEALERMCDKTASDPNSTLFQYLHAERKDEVLAEVKKRSADGQNSTVQNSEDQLLSKLNNCTLLDDVEEPSRMWENTICGDTILQTSPVKMVGLLRPSTIIEEAPDDSASSDMSSHQSFLTAAKSAQSDVSSSAYETAHDSTINSNKTDFSNKFRSEKLEEIDTDRDLLIDLNEQENKNCSTFDLMETTIVEPTTLIEKSDGENSNNKSADLIDLEQTFGPSHCSAHSPLLDKSLSRNGGKEKNIESSEEEEEFENQQNSYNVLDDSVIEIISDEEDDNVEIMKKIDGFDPIIKSETIASNTSNINSDTYSFNETNEDNKENSLENHVQLEKSMQFNDTMEEVEYLLKRGMEYMTAEAAAKRSPEKIKVFVPPCNNKVNKTQTKSPIKHLKAVKPTSYFSPSKAKSSSYTTPAKKTPHYKDPSSASKRFDIDIRPFPKLDIFAKPLDRTRTKELTSKQQKFSHIISPIGTYMKKTAETPLMSSMNCRTKDYFNSTAIMELENESRLYKPQFETNYHGGETEGLPKLPGLVSDGKRPLPKKAYISSDFKHIVDERTPVTIPGSKKIQKYLENAMMPAVLRHDGKFKVPGGISNELNTLATSSGASSKLPLKVSDANSINSSSKSSHIPRRNNASLADLSVMSGDVSMYTIMDAQKF